MNQLLLSTVLLQKSLTYNHRERIFAPEIKISRNINEYTDLQILKKNPEKSAKERNRDFFLKLSKPNNNGKSKFGDRNFKRKIRTTLIIAPHPDDEILSAANLIKDKLKSREEVKIVYLTNGDGATGISFESAQEYGKRRLNESVLAAQNLGLKKSDLIFLGFPDGHSHKLTEEKSFKSESTGRINTYDSSYFPNIAYSKKSLIKALKDIIKDIEPYEIYFTEEDDDNVDHAFIGKIFREESIAPFTKKFTYNIHRAYCKNEICSCDQEIDQDKLALIKIFRSQRFTEHHKNFLDQFACQKEVFEEVL